MEEKVKQKFATYPEPVANKLNQIRTLILRTAEQDGITSLTETTKWGEPSYVSNIGSTIRYDWKDKTPEQIGIYFNCQTKLIETFREIYGDVFCYQSNRAIILQLDAPLPEQELTHCLSLALRYKKLKHLPLLGA